MAEAHVTKTVRYPLGLYQEFEDAFPGQDFSEHTRRALRLYLRARRDSIQRSVAEEPQQYAPGKTIRRPEPPEDPAIKFPEERRA